MFAADSLLLYPSSVHHGVLWHLEYVRISYSCDARPINIKSASLGKFDVSSAHLAANNVIHEHYGLRELLSKTVALLY